MVLATGVGHSLRVVVHHATHGQFKWKWWESLLVANHNLPGAAIFAPNGLAITGDGHPVDHFFADRLFLGHSVVLPKLSGSPYAMTLHLNRQFTLAIIKGCDVIPGLRELFQPDWLGRG